MHAEGAYSLTFRPEYPLPIRLATFIYWEEIMALEVRLPGSGRFFEIRFESIGGSGAHVAGQIVASAAGTSR